MNKAENDQKYFDTYEALSAEERKELILIQKVKTNIKYFVGIDKIIEKITELIDQDPLINFASERNKKYISKTKPVFIIKINKKDLEGKGLVFLNSDLNDLYIEGKLNPKYEGDVTYLQDMVYKSIVAPYNNFLMEYLQDNEKFYTILKDNGLEEVTLDKETINLITTMSAVMFAIKVDLKNNKIFLEYAI